MAIFNNDPSAAAFQIKKKNRPRISFIEKEREIFVISQDRLTIHLVHHLRLAGVIGSVKKDPMTTPGVGKGC